MRVDVGGYQLTADHAGDSSPTVVFCSGLGDGGEVWESTIAALGPHFSTWTYSRAGIGDSDALPDNAPQSLAVSADELQQLISAAGVSTPYVAVGHSIGALVALIHAARAPEGLAGLVLVDPTDLQLDLDVVQKTLFLQDGERDDCTTYDTLASLPVVTASTRRLDIPSVVVSSRPGGWLELDDPEPWKPFTLQELDTRWQRVHEDLSQTLGGTRLVATAGAHYIHKDQPELVAQAVR
ncbi:MAG TPA: alpha/beta hydrolase, partial [Kribbella sp.]|nr:alpha/beta hydrolase [Kribbella sp.]